MRGRLAMFACIGAVVVGTVAREELTGFRAEKRRRRAIEELSDHTTIRDYVRAGHRSADELRSEGKPCAAQGSSDKRIGDGASLAADRRAPVGLDVGRLGLGGAPHASRVH